MNWAKEIDEALDRITGSVNEFGTMTTGDRERTVRNAMCHQAKLMLTTYLDENKSSLRYTAELMGSTFVLVLVERIPELALWVGKEAIVLSRDPYIAAGIHGDGRVILSSANDWELVNFVWVDQIDWTEEAWGQYATKIDALIRSFDAVRLAVPTGSADPKQVAYSARLNAAINENGIGVPDLERKLGVSPVYIFHILNGRVKFVPEHVRREIQSIIGPSLYDEWMRPIKKGND